MMMLMRLLFLRLQVVVAHSCCSLLSSRAKVRVDVIGWPCALWCVNGRRQILLLMLTNWFIEAAC